MDEYEEFLSEVVLHIVRTEDEPIWHDNPAKLSCGIYTDKPCLISRAAIELLKPLNKVSYAQRHVYDMFCSGQSMFKDRTFLYVRRAISDPEDLEMQKLVSMAKMIIVLDK